MTLSRHWLRPVLAAALFAAPALALADEGPGGWQASPFPGDRGNVSEPQRAPATPVPDLQSGQRPASDSVEAGLWMVMDDVERKLRQSGRLLHDAELQAYLRGIVCRLAPDHCDNIRIYLVRTPLFNANMAPNGTMQVWTGLLLRCENEAQLAYILAHELAHYLRRHSLQQWRNMHATTTGLLFVQILTAAAGVGFVGDLAQLVGYAALFGYSRDQEREADLVGFQMMADAGYRPDQAALVWANLIAERETEDGQERTLFFATHPAEEERVATLQEQAAARSAADAAYLGDETHFAATARHLQTWGRDELRRRKLAQSRVLFARLLQRPRLAGLSGYFLGEANRLEGTDEADAKAIELFEAAVAGGNTLPEVYRSLGLVHWQRGEDAAAASSFRRYLAEAPDADDHEMVQSYLEELE